MNYRKVYMKIISKAKSENRKKYCGIYYELHHILPKSLFNLWSKRKLNLVLLTAREHFFCHQLLSKIYPGEKMFLALWRLANDKKHIINSHEYERLRIYRALNNKKNIGSKRTEETKRKMSISQKIACTKKINKRSHTQPHSLESKRKISETLSMYRWYTNGIETIRVKPGTEPNGYLPGQVLKKKKEKIKNKKNYYRSVFCLELNKTYIKLTDVLVDGFKPSAVCDCCRKRRIIYKGYHFSYC